MSLKKEVHFIEIDSNHAGRRIDNFLFSQLKGLPRNRVYQMLRKGEVRVNKGRIKQDYRLKNGDSIRIPPVYMEADTEKKQPGIALQQLLQKHILYEDNYLIIINKPSGLPVHGGSGNKMGLIEAFREMRGDPNLSLVHRLDKATSGCLMIAKQPEVLRQLNRMLKQGEIEKTYLALLKGILARKNISMELPLQRQSTAVHHEKVKIDQAGKMAHTLYKLKETLGFASLVEVELKTGRMHQIRVHSAHMGHPVAGDDRYGDRAFNRNLKSRGLKRLFLHAYTLSLLHPVKKKYINVHAPLPDDLQTFLDVCQVNDG